MAQFDVRRGPLEDLEAGYGKEDGMFCAGIDEDGKLSALSVDYVDNNQTKRAIMKIPKIELSIDELKASSWANSRYSFETDYPATDYDISIDVSETATDAQMAAFSKAKIIGDDSENTLIARGTVPSVDIPIRLEVTNR